MTNELELLIDELEDCARLIERDSVEFSEMFINYACRLRDAKDLDVTIDELYQYATHYKGLADERPASISTPDWTEIVERLRRSTILAFNAK